MPARAGSSSVWGARPRPTADSVRCGQCSRCHACAASSWKSRATCARRSSTPQITSHRRRVRPPRKSSCSAVDCNASRRCTWTNTASMSSRSRVRVQPVGWRGGRGAGGAGGGAGGAPAAAGATLVEGFDLVADEVKLDDKLEGADLVVTGEGFLDEQSFEGKVVGGVLERAASAGVPVLVIAGEVYDDVASRADAVSLVQRYGEERARGDTLACIEEVVSDRLSSG